MRGNGGLYSIVHTTCSSCDEAWIGAGFMRGSVGFLRLQSVAEILWPYGN